MKSLIVWLRRKNNKELLGSFAALAAIFSLFVGGVWKLFTWFFDAPPAVVQTVGDSGITLSQTGKGTIYVTNTQGISTEDYKRLAAELGVTQAALGNFFKILEQRQVTPETLDSTLREIAKNYLLLRTELSASRPNDTAVAKLKQDAVAALEQGQFNQVESLLSKARTKELETAKNLDRTSEDYLRSAARLAYALGSLKLTQLAYADAALYFHEAAETLPSADNLERATYLILSGNAAFAGAYTDPTGNLDRQAVRDLKSGLSIQKKVLPAEDPRIGSTLGALASQYQNMRYFAEAETLYKEQLAIYKKVYPSGHINISTTLNNLAVLYGNQGRNAEAEAIYKEALVIAKKFLPPEHPRIGMSLDSLASFYRNQNRYTEAKQLYKEALATFEKHGPNLDQSFEIASLSGLAMIYVHEGRYVEAESFYKKALTISKKKSASSLDPLVIRKLSELASLYDNQGRYADAEPLYKEILDINKRIFPTGHLAIANSFNDLAVVYALQGRYVEAEPLFKEALTILKKSYPHDHPLVGSIQHNLDNIRHIKKQN